MLSSKGNSDRYSTARSDCQCPSVIGDDGIGILCGKALENILKLKIPN